MFNGFENLFVYSINPGQVIVNMVIAFICGFLISIIYRWTYSGPTYSVTYLNSLIVLSMITSIVIMVIGNNLARAFGLVGAMSIIRFRTAIKDTQDIVFIFFSLAVGMASGVGMHLIALFGVLLIGAVFIVLSKTQFAYPLRKELLVQFSYKSGSEGETPYLTVFKKYCKSSSLINVKAIGGKGNIEISYYVHLHQKDQSKEFVSELKNIPGIDYVNLLFDEEKF
ncbi:MAG: DUF4956 domain-containing protein [Candidatus Marinimicrobia bacterium]|nr:DUF4956 domain-containing protein [Candidatus Neomarinimicrobiota bacterium]